MVASLCEDTNENDLHDGCNDSHIQESPIAFLNSPIYNIEEKYAYV
jgi:hypothetical protein